MPSEVNHHVGYSQENECWFIRLYPYQTEQQANEAAAAFTRPAPAATDTGLKTIGFVPPMFVEGKGADYNDIFRSVSIAENYTAVVTRSQAEELLAAKDAERAEQWRLRREMEADRDTQKAIAASLEADNAAQAARIKELEQINASLMGDDEDKPRYTTKRLKQEIARATEALEAKLAAAEKALEQLADIADLIDAETEGMAETDELVLHFHDYEFAKWPVSFFRKARAVLGGKP